MRINISKCKTVIKFTVTNTTVINVTRYKKVYSTTDRVKVKNNYLKCNKINQSLNTTYVEENDYTLLGS